MRYNGNRSIVESNAAQRDDRRGGLEPIRRSLILLSFPLPKTQRAFGRDWLRQRRDIVEQPGKATGRVEAETSFWVLNGLKHRRPFVVGHIRGCLIGQYTDHLTADQLARGDDRAERQPPGWHAHCIVASWQQHIAERVIAAQ